MLRLWNKITGYPPLHSATCTSSFEDINTMYRQIQNDSESVERLQKPTFLTALSQTYPLHDAVEKKHARCVQLLLKSGANPNLLDPKGDSALFLVTSHYNSEISTEIAKSLLENGAFTIEKNNEFYYLRYRILIFAIKNSRISILKLLLKFGDELNESEHIYNLIRISIENKNREIFALLLLFSKCEMSYYEYILDETYDASIPHLLMNCLDMFEIYKEFGGNLWTVHYISKNNVLVDLRKWYTDLKKDLNVIKPIEKLMKTPLSLESHCRNALRNYFGRNYCQFIYKCNVPNVMKDFLMYGEFITWY